MPDSHPHADQTDRASPIKTSRKHAEDVRPDKSYRRWASGVERALSSFDSARLEWPDYISFLGRLLKAVQGHPPSTESFAFPHKHMVANRLAQCLRPSLPSGVHQKALELYAVIFALIGEESLAHDLPVFLPGISAVFGFASLSLRPAYLSLLETYVLPIRGAYLRPALKALILSVLPGLEEENSEDFERTLQLVDNFKAAVNDGAVGEESNVSSSGDEFFWQSFFLASIGSPSRRQGALSYLSKKLPRLVGTKQRRPLTPSDSAPSQEDCLSPTAESVVLPEPGLLVRCLVTGLEDEQLLIQRGFLDLLLSHLPLDSPVLVDRVSPQDLVRLIGGATGVVARRDMSLNRRLWSWFLGPDDDERNEEQDASSMSPKASRKEAADQTSASTFAYFEKYGSASLQQSILQMLNDRSLQPSKRARPFRICLSLMDRWEIGNTLVPKIFLPAMENVYDYKLQGSQHDFQEALRSASSFFDGVESRIIWGKIAELSVAGLGPDKTDRSHIDMAHFILEHFNVREDEMLAVHTPLNILLLLARVHELEMAESASEAVKIGEDRLIIALPLIARLLDSLPDVNSAGLRTEEKQVDEDVLGRDTNWTTIIEEAYAIDKRRPSSISLPFSTASVNYSIFIECAGLVARLQDRGCWAESLVYSCRIFANLLTKLPVPHDFDLQALILSARDSLVALEASVIERVSTAETLLAPAVRFPALNAVTLVLAAMSTVAKESAEQSSEALVDLVAMMVRNLWGHLSPSNPKYHLEAVRCIWQLEELMTKDDSIEAAITSFLAESNTPMTSSGCSVLEHARRFAILWTHTSYIAPQPSRSARNTWSRLSSVTSDAQFFKSHSMLDNQEKLYRPLLLLLDLSDTGVDPDLQNFTRAWLGSSPNAARVLDILVTKIHLASSAGPGGPITSLLGARDAQSRHEDRADECLYYLQRLLNFLESGTPHLWAATLEAHSQRAKDDHDVTNILIAMMSTCLTVLKTSLPSNIGSEEASLSLAHASASVILTGLQSPVASHLGKLQLEDPLLDLLRQCSQSTSELSTMQVVLLDMLLASLRVRGQPLPADARPKLQRAMNSKDTIKSQPSTTDLGKVPDADVFTNLSLDLRLCNELVKAMTEGLESSASNLVLEHWIHFLVAILPSLAANLFSSIIPLVESFCHRIRLISKELVATFSQPLAGQMSASESSLMALLNGLEYLLAYGHDQMSREDSRASQQLRTPEPSQGFFGNVVSGVFSAADVPKGRPAAANTRLTIILCFQDALRIGLSVWSWGVYDDPSDRPDPTCLASFAYVSQRLRNKTRRILDRMFAVEGLECLETLIVAWTQTSGERPGASSVISLLHALDASGPRQTLPSLFNAIYSRTSLTSIDPQRASTLTSDITEMELAQFLLEYTRSLDDDVMDEIWVDCMTFLRDVMSNPQPHAAMLPALLQFTILLAEKVDKTNFGEQRKMRKELGDLFLRLLLASFTIRPGSAAAEIPSTEVEQNSNTATSKSRYVRRKDRNQDLVVALATIVPKLPTVIPDNDRLVAAVANISSNVISPLLHAKSFPDNLKAAHLVVWQQLVLIPQASRVWRKDLSDLFMHPRLFSAPPAIAVDHLNGLVRQIAISDRDRVSELCGRISPPTSAGILFGVGANAARTEGDKKTQLLLRRMAYLVLAADEDHAVTHLTVIEEKVTELLTATVASSPSAATRAEVFMLLRSIMLRTTAIHLSPLWPLITSELQRAVSSALPRSAEYELYNAPSLLQACKLLDLLVIVSPDEFQMQEWFFITDTIEAVYRPGNWTPVALVDEISEELGASGPPTGLRTTGEGSREEPLGARAMRHTELMLTQRESMADMSKEVLVDKVLRPFFAQLSIHSYEACYSMKAPDWHACRTALMMDLFDDTTIVG